MNQSNEKKVQIILLTGYLGAGKTTLINYILKNQTQFKVAVIQNEFADEMGIESPLIQDAEGKPFDKFYELPNGCICCSAKGELLVAVEYFIKEYNNLDVILIETNGLADPSATIQQFWVDQELKFPAELAVVHAIIPTHRIEELGKEELFQKQLVYADNILLNYIDKASDEQIKAAKELLQDINPTCKIFQSSFAQFPLADLFKAQSQKPQLTDISENDHSHFHSSINHYFYKGEIAYEKQKWEHLFGMLLWESDIKILRVKGLLKIKNEQNAYSLQGVNDTFEIQQTNTTWDQIEDNLTKILFIGENLKEEDILKAIQM